MSSGTGSVYRPTYTYKGKEKRSKVWWLDYSIDGKRTRESAETTDRKAALDKLHDRLRERGRGVSMRDLERVEFRELADLIEADYSKNGRKSADRLKQLLAHLRAAFGGWRAIDITEAVIDRYAADRLAEGAAPGTVNREISALRRMFNLGKRARLVGRVPAFDMLEERNVRTGFVGDAQYRAIRKHLPEHHRPILDVAYVTGWRKGEILSRRWEHVDFRAGTLRLEPRETKNDEPRIFPLVGPLRETLEAQRERKRAVEKATGRIVSALFFFYRGKRAGRPIKEPRRSFDKAFTDAGCPDLIFHDLRRTAARNLVRAGVPEQVAMRLTGHKTRSIFDRYAIVDEALLREGAEKLARHLEAERQEPERKVVAMRGGSDR